MSSISIPGHKLLHEEKLKQLRTEVSRILKRKSSTFPGSQPVSLGTTELQYLLDEDYFVCEKSDGLRFLMYITKEEVTNPNVSNGVQEKKEIQRAYLINRKNDYYQIFRLHFPKPSSRACHHDTIIDGELVKDVEEDGTEVLRFLVFDCLAVDNKLLIDRDLTYRLGHYRSLVHVPFKAWFKSHPEAASKLPFDIEFKEMQLSYGIRMMFETVMPKLKHQNDGLIFTPIKRGYVFGTDERLLKWKPLSENSVDFKLFLKLRRDSNNQLILDAKPDMELWAWTGEKEPLNYCFYAMLSVDDEEWAVLQQYKLQGAIVECVLNNFGEWKLFRFRTDKKDANHISIIKKIELSIKDPVDKEKLLKMDYEIKKAFKQRQAKAAEIKSKATHELNVSAEIVKSGSETSKDIENNVDGVAVKSD